jgi:hypothetical protein
MAKLIELPPNFGNVSLTELPLNKFMARLVVYEHILKSGASLIVAGPSAVNKFKLPVFQKPAHKLLLDRRLLLPPHLEKLELRPREPSRGVFAERYHNSGQNSLNAAHLILISIRNFAAIEVGVYGFVPAYITMGMRYQMYRDDTRIDLAISYLLGNESA